MVPYMLGKYVNISAGHPMLYSHLFASRSFPELRRRVLPPELSGFCSVTNIAASGVSKNIEIMKAILKSELKFNALMEHNKAFGKEVFTELPAAVVQAIKAH